MGLFDQRKASSTLTATTPKKRYGVLLVDDEILNLTSLASMLEDDYNVHIASSANDALQTLNTPSLASEIHIILSDQRMPGMTGVELLAKARVIKPDAKRILLTGYSDLDAIVSAINEASVYKYLRKPVESNELRLTLQRACEAWQLEHDNNGLLAELKQAYEKLKLQDDDKMTFLRYLAHEMNTPLNWLSAAQIIDREQLGDEAKELLSYVDQGQERLHLLINAVLRYFQAAGMHLMPHRDHLDASVLLSQKIHALQDRFGSEVMIRLEQPPTVTMETDMGVVSEILDHLLENALSHTRRQDRLRQEMHVHLGVHDKHIEIDVFNQGDDVHEEILAQIFTPFRFTGSAHSGERFGLSLATARVLAVSLGGDLISVTHQHSEQGLRLRLTLPQVLPWKTRSV